MARDRHMQTEGVSACVLPAFVRLARAIITDPGVYVKRCDAATEEWCSLQRHFLDGINKEDAEV